MERGTIFLMAMFLAIWLYNIIGVVGFPSQIANLRSSESCIQNSSPGATEIACWVFVSERFWKGCVNIIGIVQVDGICGKSVIDG